MEISHNYLLNKTYPQTLAFQKMEFLVKAMQHPQTGVPVRSQKLFLTTVPNAFTGEELIDWMVNRLDLKDSEEALHLASVLCKYGYFFHVTLNDTTDVKEDGELYRFQAPYYWISTNWNAGNTDYAIYLIKRTLRDQEKHGLDEVEHKILQDLKKKLTHQWDFIRMQADSQLRVLKDRKKTDKTIIDSQEKAFWNIVRPLNENGSSIMDEDIKLFLSTSFLKTFKPDEMIRKKYKFMMNTLKNRIRTKTSQALPSMCAYAEAYCEYDAFMGHCQPSNPWVTEDTTFWDVNASLVESPTQLRIKRWSFSFKELLSDPTGVREFMKFCETEFSTESLKFYLACQEVKQIPTSEIKDIAHKIVREYLSADGGAEVNINDTIRSRILKKLDTPQRDMFFEAEKHIYELMKKNSYPRFEQSDQYNKLLANAIIPAPKRAGIFHFVKRDYFRSSDDDSTDYDSESMDNNDAATNNNTANNQQALQSSQNNVNNNLLGLSTSTMTGVAIAGAVGNASALTAAVASITSPPLNKLNTFLNSQASLDEQFLSEPLNSSKRSNEIHRKFTKEK